MTGLEDYELREEAAIKSARVNLSDEFFSHHLAKGGFAAVLDFMPGSDRVLLKTLDGAGTKVLVPQWLSAYDPKAFTTIAIDALAMSMNDLAPYGEINSVFVSAYFPVQEIVERNELANLNKGLDSGMQQCRFPEVILNYGKFETASVDETLSGVRRGYGFDVATCAAAFMRRHCLPAFQPSPGDRIVGFGASGLHANGFTAARHSVLSPKVEPRDEWKGQYRGRFGLDDLLPGSDKTVGEALLTPTQLYFSAMQRIARELPGTYGFNITGNGLKNFNRYGRDIAYVINRPLEPTAINRLVVEEGKYPAEKAYTKFNMGMGFAVVVKDEEEESVVCMIAESEGISARNVGFIDACEGAPVTVLERRLGEDGTAGKVRMAEFRGYHA